MSYTGSGKMVMSNTYTVSGLVVIFSRSVLLLYEKFKNFVPGKESVLIMSIMPSSLLYNSEKNLCG